MSADIEEVEFVDRIGLDFDKFNISTMTASFPNLSGHIKLFPLFYLIPWDKINLKIPITHRSKKIKIPEGLPCGTIVSLRCAGRTRGLVRIAKDNAKKFFQNAIAIDVSTGTKTICVKLNSKSIHISGAKDEKMAYIGAKIVYDHVINIMKFMKEYNQYKEDIEAFMKAVKGEKCNVILRFVAGGTPFTYSYQDYVLKQDEKEYEGVREEVVKIFHPLLKDYQFYGQFAKLVSSLNKNRYIGEDDYQINWNLNIHMINYNYHLPFEVNRKALDTLMQDRHGFHSFFNNRQQSAVTIQLPYEKKDGRKKNLHTFMVRRSGAVMQSGPSIELMREAFLYFIMALSEIRDEIES